MNKKNKIVLISLSVVALLVVGYFVLVQSRSTGGNYHWRKTYHPDKKNPFDTYIIYHLLEEGTPDGELTRSETSFKNFNWRKAEPLNYVFIGDHAYYSAQDEDSLLAFVAAGNNAFIAHNYFSYTFMDKLVGVDTLESYLLYQEALSIESCVDSDCYVFKYQLPQEVKELQEWNYFEFPAVTKGVEEVGHFDTIYPNFIRIRHGEGNFYFHANPLMFTNLFMADSLTWQYADEVFAQMPAPHFYWDQHAYVNLSDMYSDEYQNPLKHIFSTRSLMWAWYAMLLLVLLYVLLNSKRKQNFIPYIEPNENSTIEFTETIGRLYFKEQNHYKIVQLMMKLFLFNLYHKYRIPVHKTQDEPTLARLAAKTGAEEGLFRKIVDKYNFFASKAFTENKDLIEFYQLITAYNNACK